MKSILIKNADYLVTMDKDRHVLRNSSVYIEPPKIVKIGGLGQKADRIIDAKGKIVFPGFINTHLHTPQVFHRHCPAQQNKPIDQWIQITTSINREIDEESMYLGALICFAELIYSGVTTTSDYFYPYPKGKEKINESTIKAAQKIGLRFTSIRGSMTLSRKDGAHYPDDVVETSEEIVERSQRFIEKYHDNSPFSMIRIGIGPCLPFASTQKDFQNAAALARKYRGVILQTHAAESLWEAEYTREKFGVSPIGLMEKTGFLGKDVGLAHCNVCNDSEIDLLAETRTNVIITPVCNTRDAADGNLIAPINKLLAKKINISIGTDGPASNDSMNFLEEMRYLRVVSMGKLGLDYLSPSKVFDIGTLGGAKTLNRQDIGSIEEGKAADLVVFNPEDELNHAGAINKWGALISCQAIKPEYVIINGQVIVDKKELITLNLNTALKKFQKRHHVVIKRAQQKLAWNLNEYSFWERSIWS
ncbi:MAG: amidohydrolase family protein [Patescibacteria group bacterium]|nr:amidohydrolase family protein [Patescibacteria group bacterium]MCL5095343.1 amidohydrolase family protein [Patescibacteria group bacterium]